MIEYKKRINDKQAINKIPVAKLIAFAMAIFCSVAASTQSAELPFSIRFQQYDYQKYNQLVAQRDFVIDGMNELLYGSTRWKISVDLIENDPTAGIYEYEVRLECLEGHLDQSSISILFKNDSWHDSNFVLMPGALYNGNKYEYRRIRYSPKLLDPRDIGPDVPILLSDVPRLNHTDGTSRVQLRSGATTSPSISYYDSIQNVGFMLLTEQGNAHGDFGLEIEELRGRTSAEILITSPLVRQRHQYFANDNLSPSDDKPANFKAGDVVNFKFKVYSFSADKVQDLFDKFAEVRKELSPDGSYNNVLPLSQAYTTVANKFKRDNWVDLGENGYFSVGMRENFLQDFQTGWTGGMISTYPLLHSGDKEAQNLVIKNFDWFFPNSITPAGFFYGFNEGGTHWFGGDKRKFHTKDWLLTRKSADAIFYIVQQLSLMEAKKIPVDKKWEAGVKTVCDAFVKLWDANRQIGQFIDANTGEIQVGGSSSAGILPAGLVLASRYFERPDYLSAAIEVADYYYENFTKMGISCGGPGDALQNFDSESAYGLVESYYTLYEATQDEKWEVAAAEAARQFATWVIAYNYKFPKDSTFGKLGMHSIGAVWANTQNTHGSPGICTHSGLALLKLFRSTGDMFYAELLADITHAIPQCLSVPTRKILDAKDGWMSERISTTDWNEGIGEIFVGTTWAETALMLSYTQIPGVYICTATSEVIAFDSIEVEIIEDTPKRLRVRIANPTNLDATVRIWEENGVERKSVLDNNYLLNSKEVNVPKFSSINMAFTK